jgi:hypothetical protein
MKIFIEEIKLTNFGKANVGNLTFYILMKEKELLFQKFQAQQGFNKRKYI